MILRTLQRKADINTTMLEHARPLANLPTAGEVLSFVSHAPAPRANASRIKLNHMRVSVAHHTCRHTIIDLTVKTYHYSNACLKIHQTHHMLACCMYGM